MKNNNRLLELDALRGLAALAVVIFHYTTRYDQIYTHDKANYFQFPYGYYGVQLFFMISGFVIFMTVQNIQSVKGFIYKRAMRLYPVYISSVIITFTIVLIFGLEGREVSLFEALVNLTMLQGFVGIPHVDGAYWSLQIELLFYAIIAITMYLGFIHKFIYIIYGWILISFTLKASDILIDNFIISIWNSLLIAQYSHLFIAGIVFYHLRTYTSQKKKFLLILLICLVYEYSFFNVTSNFFTTLFFMMFYLLIFNHLKFLQTKFLIFLGGISYSLYVVHQNIGYVIFNYMEDNGYNHELYLLIPLTVSIMLSWILTTYVEKPFVSLMYRLKNKKSSKIIRKAI